MVVDAVMNLTEKGCQWVYGTNCANVTHNELPLFIILILFVIACFFSFWIYSQRKDILEMLGL